MDNLLQVLILCLADNIACKILFDCFFNNRANIPFSKWFYIFLLGIPGVILSIFCGNLVLRITIYPLFITIIYNHMYDTRFINTFIASVAYIALVMCIETPSYIIFTYLLGPERIEQISTDYFSLTIIGLTVKLFTFIVVILISRLFGRKGYLKFLNFKDWLTFLCLPLFSVVILVSLVVDDIKSLHVIISMMLLLINVIFYNYLQENGINNKRKIELIALEERNRSQLQSFRDIGGLYEEQHLRIHEFKNQIKFISGLLAKAEYDTLETYLRKITADMASKTQTIETGNPVTNVLINQAVKTASQNDISIMPNISISDRIQIDDNDLVIIISNLLNNAIEHCETLKRSNKIITFKLESTAAHLLIICINPIESPIVIENNLIKSTKNNPAEHGYGLKNIARTVDKYNGDICISADDNKFKYVIMINYEGDYYEKC